MAQVNDFISLLTDSLQEDSFVKITLGNYKGSIDALKKCIVKNVHIQGSNKLSFTYRHLTKDIVKNYTYEESVGIIERWLGNREFCTATLFTLKGDFLYEVRNDKIFLKRNAPTHFERPSTEHNSKKNRAIDSKNKSYLHLLKITDANGNVYHHAQDKYKQINHYIDILNPLMKDFNQNERVKVIDMGAGKGYLTFALYDYLTSVLKLEAEVTGVEYRDDLVALCNNIASECGFKGLNFTQGTILDFRVDQSDILIALHACDTATDDAIYKGIESNAKLIVVAPCCHKQIRREMEKSKIKNDLDFLLKHGIFMEREAEMITDGLRSLLLEFAGYSTKVFEFVSGEHTPKNLMIVGQKKAKTKEKTQEILEKIKAAKAYFGIHQHHLEMLILP